MLVYSIDSNSMRYITLIIRHKNSTECFLETIFFSLKAMKLINYLPVFALHKRFPGNNGEFKNSGTDHYTLTSSVILHVQRMADVATEDW